STPPTHTLFPYTTLFRSHSETGFVGFLQLPRHAPHTLLDLLEARRRHEKSELDQDAVEPHAQRVRPLAVIAEHERIVLRASSLRSEEHTSELQSQSNLVC